MMNDETDSTMAPPWWRISASSGRHHGDMDDVDDDTDDDDDYDDDTDDDNDHKDDSYTAAGAAPGPHGSPGGTFYPEENKNAKLQEVLSRRRLRFGVI